MSDVLHHVIVKFCEMYERPYQITKGIIKDVYELKHIDGKKKTHGIFNMKKLERFKKLHLFSLCIKDGSQ